MNQFNSNMYTCISMILYFFLMKIYKSCHHVFMNNHARYVSGIQVSFSHVMHHVLVWYSILYDSLCISLYSFHYNRSSCNQDMFYVCLNITYHVNIIYNMQSRLNMSCFIYVMLIDNQCTNHTNLILLPLYTYSPKL